MTPRRRARSTDTTAGGCWRSRQGRYGTSVTVRERSPGGRVVLQWTDADGRRRAATAETGSVRDTQGRLIAARCREAEAEAEARAKRLADALGEPEAPAATLSRRQGPITLAGGLALYHGTEGGLPRSTSARQNHERARQFWVRELGAETPWNDITPALRDAALGRARSAGLGVPTLEKYCRCLRTVHRWLVDAAEIDELRDPMRRLDFRRLVAGHDPRRPRYTQEEIARIWAVADRVDPRFRLAVALVVDSGARSAAAMRATRSMVDAPLDTPPPEGYAPHGWILWPALKGQERALSYLTARQRREFDHAAGEGGFLYVCERKWQARGVDYPLLPGGVLPRSGAFRGLRHPISSSALHTWLAHAEELAGLERVERRAWHAFRRAFADWTEERAGLDVLMTAGGWHSREMPERVYTQRQKHHRLRASLEAQEQRVGGGG